MIEVVERILPRRPAGAHGIEFDEDRSTRMRVDDPVIFGRIQAAIEKVVAAVVRKTGDHIYPTGPTAANKIGLTTQVPAKTAYVTTGKPRDVQVWNVKIKLHKATLPKTLTRPLAYMALQALDNIGPDYVDKKMIDKTAKYLKPADKKDIHDNLRYIRNPWLTDIARQLTQ